MKRKNILNKLRLEFEDSMPDSNKLLNQIKDAKVEKDLTPVYETINSNGVMAIKVRQNLMFISGIMFLTMLMFTLFLICLPILIAVLYPETTIVTKFGIDINPSIELMLDENDKVVLCLAKNKHAEVLINGETFVGLDVETVTERIITLATKAGYFTTIDDEDDVANAVMLSAISEDETKQRNLLNEVKSKVKNFYVNNQIYGVVLTEFASKQELVDLVCSLDYSLTEEQQNGLINESVKSLNKRLNDSYTVLKRRFKSDFILEELNKYINPINEQFEQNKNELRQKLNDAQVKLNNFESDWIAETGLCQEKIEFWENEIANLRKQLELETDNENKRLLEQEIQTKQMFLLSEQTELENRAVNGDMFNASKRSLTNQIQTYTDNLNGFSQQYKTQIEAQLNVVKNNIGKLDSLMQQRKNYLINLYESKLKQHLSGLGDYNEFYNSYSNWLNSKAEELESIRTNWESVKANWEQSYTNFVQF